MIGPDPERDRTIKLAVDSDLENVPLVGLAAQSICRDAGLSDLEAYHVELCLIEAVTNSIRHAYGDAASGQVRITLTIGCEELWLCVEDDGAPMPGDLAAPTLEFDPDDVDQLPEGGMGRFIMHNLMDRVEYTSSGGSNVLRMEKARERKAS